MVAQVLAGVRFSFKSLTDRNWTTTTSGCQVAARAAENSGVDSGILKKMLPMLASVAMGAMAKQGFGAGSANQLAGGQGGGLGGLLASFLDADKDGSILDDVLGMAGKLMR